MHCFCCAGHLRESSSRSIADIVQAVRCVVLQHIVRYAGDLLLILHRARVGDAAPRLILPTRQDCAEVKDVRNAVDCLFVLSPHSSG